MKQAAFEVRYGTEIDRFEKWLDCSHVKRRKNKTTDGTAGLQAGPRYP